MFPPTPKYKCKITLGYNVVSRHKVTQWEPFIRRKLNILQVKGGKYWSERRPMREQKVRLRIYRLMSNTRKRRSQRPWSLTNPKRNTSRPRRQAWKRDQRTCRRKRKRKEKGVWREPEAPEAEERPEKEEEGADIGGLNPEKWSGRGPWGGTTPEREAGTGWEAGGPWEGTENEGEAWGAEEKERETLGFGKETEEPEGAEEKGRRRRRKRKERKPELEEGPEHPGRKEQHLRNPTDSPPTPER